MPELPEVEVTARRIRSELLGRTITASRISWARSLATHSPQEFLSIIEKARVRDVSRRAKFVVVTLVLRDRIKKYILIHLRMSGSLDVVSAGAAFPRHERVALRFSGNRELRFNDPRKFGRFYLIDDLPHFTRKLGPEPLDEDLTQEQFFDRLRLRRGRIKPLLLKQDFIAGIGNIYADEALWRAQISPLRLAEQLSRRSIYHLFDAIRDTLKRAIRAAGTDSGDHVVKDGAYRPRVYGRQDLSCYRCHAKIKKIVLGQRGTHYCAGCQR